MKLLAPPATLPIQSVSCFFPGETPFPLPITSIWIQASPYLTWMSSVTYKLVPTALWLSSDLLSTPWPVWFFSKSNVILSHLPPLTSCPILRKTQPSLPIAHRMKSPILIASSRLCPVWPQLPPSSLLWYYSLISVLQPQWPCFHDGAKLPPATGLLHMPFQSDWVCLHLSHCLVASTLFSDHRLTRNNLQPTWPGQPPPIPSHNSYPNVNFILFLTPY